MSTKTAIFRCLCSILSVCVLAGCGGRGRSGSVPDATYAVGGTVNGLSGTLVLQNNGGNDLTLRADGSFSFSQALTNGSAYAVTVRTPPSFPPQACTVTNGSGTIGRANVTNVHVMCAGLAATNLQADAGVSSVTLSWSPAPEAQSFNLYVSTARNCDIRNYNSCSGGAMLTNVASPHTVKALHNGQAYFFRLETIYANGARGVSNDAGARPNVLAFNGSVRAIAAAANGGVHVGGDFTQVGITTGSAVPLDTNTGRLTAPDFPIVTGHVLTTLADGAGGWYLGGSFTHVGNAARSNLAHVLADGAVDPDFHPDPNGVVNALARSGDVLYVGGFFTAVANQPRLSLAAIDTRGALLPWNPIAFGSVNALAIADGVVYAGGAFTELGGGTRNRLAAIRTDGVLLPLNPSANDKVTSLVASNGVVYAGGLFTEVGGQTRNRLAAISADGALLSWSPEANQLVQSLAVSGDIVYAGGAFTALGDIALGFFGAVDASIGEIRR
jgi:trimeric autotransporter adhesin